MLKLIKIALGRTGFICIILLMPLLLWGCVDYDVGINFGNANRGELVQQIKLGDRLTSFSGDSVYEWLNSIERRARQQGGRAKRVSESEVIVRIPFTNNRELQKKYNEFFSSNSDKTSSNSELPNIASNLLLNQNNFLVLVRNRLIYDLDLRSLALITSDGNVLSKAGSILDLELRLKTPWGAKSVENSVKPVENKHELVWQLQPGELNHIEAVFWLPSPMGIGTLLIVLFVLVGFFLRYSFMPDPRVQFAPSPAAK